MKSAPLLTLLVLVVLVLAACGDVAERSYDACVQAESSGDLGAAIKACAKATKLSTTSPKGKLAVAKLAELRPKFEAYKVEHMKMLTEEFCDRLVDHLQPKVVSFMAEQEAEKPPSIRAAPGVIEAMALDYAKTKATSCKDDVFYKRNVAYWKCQWLADIKDADKCKEDKSK